jgi:uncharacterized membrane protein
VIGPSGIELAVLPQWAPNLHPLIVHFPIALLIGALAADLASLLLPRAAWADSTAATLYLAGAVSACAAYLSGRQAAAAVLVPGMAQVVVRDHWNWALATTITFALVAAMRLVITLSARRQPFWVRASAVAAGCAGVLMLVETAGQGARLVFEFGVGVLPRIPR